MFALKTYMLDTCICSYIIRESPFSVLERLQQEVSAGNRIVISAITYAEMRYGQIGKKASPKLAGFIDQFVSRLDGILPWDREAVDSAVEVRTRLAAAGTPIGNNDSAIAAHAISAECVLVTNNTREFSRVDRLDFEDWVVKKG